MYLQVGVIKIDEVLAAPAAAGSSLEDAELAMIRAVQHSASAEAKALADADIKMTFSIFADIVGPDFTPKKQPATFAWLQQGARDASAIINDAKKQFNRARPSTIGKKPSGEPMETSPSYPSGHAGQAAVWAEMLALVHPSKAEALRERAAKVGVGRVILGVHYPSDVIAGHALGVEIVKRMQASEAFKADVTKVQSEIEGAAVDTSPARGEPQPAGAR